MGEEGERNREGRGFAGALAGDEGSLAQTRGGIERGDDGAPARTRSVARGGRTVSKTSLQAEAKRGGRRS